MSSPRPIPPAAAATSSPGRRRLTAILLHAMVLALAACGALVLPRQAAQAQDRHAGFVTPGGMKSGALLLRTGEAGRYVEAPRLGTDIDVKVSGPTARARVTQIFHNPTDGWVEAVYVYPLPEEGAVQGLKMVVGDRVIVGEIRKREEARAIYEEAKAQGRKASLTEQERPNIFTNTVANIGPGESVVVQIEYQQPVHRSNDTFSLRIPLVVAPRYNPDPGPDPVTQTADFRAGGGWGSAPADPVPDRDRISPPALDPRAAGLVNPVTITVDLQAGFPLGTVESAHHAVAMEERDRTARTIRLDGPVPADRDFELSWQAAKGDAPDVGLFRETVGGEDYVLAYVTPPSLDEASPERPREIVFVLDNSGSMAGASIEQARASLDYALGRLKPADRFNVIRFDDTMEMLHPAAVPADERHVEAARNFVRGLDAEGGTEMLPPLEAALADPLPGDADHVRQIVFLTDGAIGNEQQLFDAIAARLGRSRIFMVGIGSAPNSHLMSRAAELGRGTFTHIGATLQVETRMRALFDRLESPVVTNLRAAFSEGDADVTPGVLPDLYRGEPVVLAAKVGALAGSLTLDGMIGDRAWTVTLPLDKAAKGEGISKFWANRRITDAEVAQTLGEITSEIADERIAELALRHGLVTRLTSLVAVDRTPGRPQGTALTRADLPLNLPAGWDFDKVFGNTATRHAQSHDPIDESAFEGVTRSSAPSAVARVPQPGVALPQTATAAQLKMLLGTMFLLVGITLLLLRAKRGARR